MEKYTVFMDWKNQYCQNDYTTQRNLQIEYNPYQATNGIFHRTKMARTSSTVLSRTGENVSKKIKIAINFR